MDKARLNFEQLLKLLQEFKAVINNRLLTSVYNTPCAEALAPNLLVFWRKLNLNDVNREGNVELDANKRYDHFKTGNEHFIKL